jgi:cardiolipin synthase C
MAQFSLGLFYAMKFSFYFKFVAQTKTMRYFILILGTLFFISMLYGQEGTANNQVAILDDGGEALAKRLELIHSAREKIYLETYIIDTSPSAQLVLSLLAEKAQKKVDVRILLDGLFMKHPNVFILEELRQSGVKFKFYNRTPILNFVRWQNRDHRKILVVDGRVAIVGGRNIADDYFWLSNHFNLLDLDWWLEGPIIPQLEASFLTYWNHPYGQAPKAPRRPDPEKIKPQEYPGKMREHMQEQKRDQEFKLAHWIKMTAEAHSFLQLSSDLLALEQKIMAQTHHRSLRLLPCPDLSMITNPPGANFYKNQVGRKLYQLMSEAREELIIETPYFIPHAAECKLFFPLLQNNVQVTLLTNSLRSQRDSSVVFDTIFNNRIGIYTLKGLQAFIYSGKAPSCQQTPETPETKIVWGIHSKAMVIDGHTSLIGSYNIDPHSKNFNNEIMLVCRNNPAVAQELKGVLSNHQEMSYRLNRCGFRKNYHPTIGGAPLWKQLNYILFYIPGELASFLL